MTYSLKFFLFLACGTILLKSVFFLLLFHPVGLLFLVWLTMQLGRKVL